MTHHRSSLISEKWTPLDLRRSICSDAVSHGFVLAAAIRSPFTTIGSRYSVSAFN